MLKVFQRQNLFEKSMTTPSITTQSWQMELVHWVTPWHEKLGDCERNEPERGWVRGHQPRTVGQKAKERAGAGRSRKAGAETSVVGTAIPRKDAERTEIVLRAPGREGNLPRVWMQCLLCDRLFPLFPHSVCSATGRGWRQGSVFGDPPASEPWTPWCFISGQVRMVFGRNSLTYFPFFQMIYKWIMNYADGLNFKKISRRERKKILWYFFN